MWVTAMAFSKEGLRILISKAAIIFCISYQYPRYPKDSQSHPSALPTTVVQSFPLSGKADVHKGRQLLTNIGIFSLISFSGLLLANTFFPLGHFNEIRPYRAIVNEGQGEGRTTN